jgi:integrase
MVRLKGFDPSSRTWPEGTSHREAFEWGLEEERRLKTGDVPTLMRKKWSSITLNSLFEEYTEYFDGRKWLQKKSYEREKISISAFLERRPDIANKSILFLPSRDIQEYIDHELGRGIRSSTLKRNLLNPCSALINKFAKKRKQLSLPNPFRGLLELPDDPPPRDWVLSDDELHRLYVAIVEGCRGRHQKLLWSSLVRTALITGLRRIQLLRLQWKDVDLQNSRLWVEPAKREKKGRWLPLSIETCGFLQGYCDSVPEKDKYRLLLSQVFPITGTAHEQAWKRIVKRAKLYKPMDDGTVDWFTFHDLRHCAATYFRSKKYGLTGEQCSYMLGHIDRRMTATYEHIWDQLVDEIRTKFDEADRAYKPMVDGIYQLLPPENIADLRLSMSKEELSLYFEEDYEAWEKTKRALWQWE